MAVVVPVEVEVVTLIYYRRPHLPCLCPCPSLLLTVLLPVSSGLRGKESLFYFGPDHRMVGLPLAVPPYLISHLPCLHPGHFLFPWT